MKEDLAYSEAAEQQQDEEPELFSAEEGEEAEETSPAPAPAGRVRRLMPTSSANIGVAGVDSAEDVRSSATSWEELATAAG